MRDTTNRSRTSRTIALSLVILGMTLAAPALAAGRRDAERGAKRPVVRERPSDSTLPVGTKAKGVERGLDAVVSALRALRTGMRS